METSKTEQDILYLLTKEFLTTKQIAIRRGTGVRAVQKVIKKLKQNGMLNTANQNVRFSGPTSEHANQIRLHGQEFSVQILFKDNRYKAAQAKSNIIVVDGNTIKLSRDSIEVYMVKSFYGDDAAKAMAISMDYLTPFLRRLEDDLKVILIKNRSQNIKQVNAHFAEINNEFSEECEKKAYKVRIHTKEDGKIWFVIDNSFNLHEAECIHPKTGQEDMENVKNFFNDIRENKLPTMSEVTKILAHTQKQIGILAQSQQNIISLLSPQQVEPKEEKLERPEYIG